MNFRKRLPIPAWIPGRFRHSNLSFLSGPKLAQTSVMSEAARNDKLGAGDLVQSSFFYCFTRYFSMAIAIFLDQEKTFCLLLWVQKKRTDLSFSSQAM